MRVLTVAIALTLTVTGCTPASPPVVTTPSQSSSVGEASPHDNPYFDSKERRARLDRVFAEVAPKVTSALAAQHIGEVKVYRATAAAVALELGKSVCSKLQSEEKPVPAVTEAGQVVLCAAGGKHAAYTWLDENGQLLQDEPVITVTFEGATMHHSRDSWMTVYWAGGKHHSSERTMTTDELNKHDQRFLEIWKAAMLDYFGQDLDI